MSTKPLTPRQRALLRRALEALLREFLAGRWSERRAAALRGELRDLAELL